MRVYAKGWCRRSFGVLITLSPSIAYILISVNTIRGEWGYPLFPNFTDIIFPVRVFFLKLVGSGIFIILPHIIAILPVYRFWLRIWILRSFFLHNFCITVIVYTYCVWGNAKDQGFLVFITIQQIIHICHTFFRTSTQLLILV